MLLILYPLIFAESREKGHTKRVSYILSLSNKKVVGRMFQD